MTAPTFSRQGRDLYWETARIEVSTALVMLSLLKGELTTALRQGRRLDARALNARLIELSDALGPEYAEEAA